MSAKLLSSLSDENRDLQKQFGCMNGIFQLFDRHYFITGRRMSGGSNHNRLLPVPGAEHDTEKKTETYGGAVKNTELPREEPRISAESPRNTSSSSSGPSTFPVLNHVNTAKSKSSPISQRNYLESPSQIPGKQRTSSSYSNQQPNDLRNAVKNSIHSGSKVKTAGREEVRSHARKHIDSPRPLQLSKSSHSRLTGFDGSTRALAKIQEGPRYPTELKDGLSGLPRKDLPRFSLDGRETPDPLKSLAKFKEFPRLSLDSRESSLRSSVSESRLSHLLRGLKRDNNNHMASADEEPGSNRRPSNVVVKLMGLEAFPDSNSRSEGQLFKPHPSLDQEFESTSHKKLNKTKQGRAIYEKEEQKDPALPSSRNDRSHMKPTSTLKFPIEPAPWRQPDGSNHPQKIAQKSSSFSSEAKINSSSVYGEIEKRINELEFKKSGKDLRALKQILEAMQKPRKRPDGQQGEQADFESQTSRCISNDSLYNQISKASNWRSKRSSNIAKDSSSPRNYDLATVRTKQSKPLDNSKIFSSKETGTADTSHLQKFQRKTGVFVGEDLMMVKVAKEEKPRNSTVKYPSQCQSLMYKNNISRSSKPMQPAIAPQLPKGDIYTAFGRSSGAISPRFQANQPGLHKQSSAATPSIEVGKAGKNSSKQPIESDQLASKPRPSSISPRGCKCNPSSVTSMRNFTHIDDATLLQSESSSSASQTDNEVTSLEQSIEITTKQHIYPQAVNIAARSQEDRPLAELKVATEQPSPISVLDATFYAEDSPSPVKKITVTFQDFENREPEEAEMQFNSLNRSSGIASFSHHDELKGKPVSDRHLTPSNKDPTAMADEAGNLVARFCKNSNFNYIYIAKILLASGLLKDMERFPTANLFQSSSQLINPELFHVLEQEENTGVEYHNGKIDPYKCPEKVHRRMLFDTINEVLLSKMTSKGPYTLRKPKTEQELLKDLCSELERLQTKTGCCFDDPDGLGDILNVDMMRQPDDWTNNQSEIATVVLEIERLIFKDLITEVVNGECLGLHDLPRNPCKLYAY